MLFVFFNVCHTLSLHHTITIVLFSVFLLPFVRGTPALRFTKVCLGADNEPRGVDPTCPDDAARNIIVWLDHRAKDQAKRINQGEHSALRTVGGAVSLEMEIPKLLWLKENFPGKWLGSGGDDAFAKFFDLPDWLVFKATGQDERSLCSTVSLRLSHWHSCVLRD